MNKETLARAKELEKDIPKGCSTYETCRAIVGILFDYDSNKDKP